MMDRISPSSRDIAQQFGSARSSRVAGKPQTIFRQAMSQQLAPTESAEVKLSAPKFKQPETQQTQSNQAQQWDPPAQTAPKRVTPSFQQASLEPMLNEVTSIAKDLGYVGVTQQDVLRAYRSGQSFLADYTV